MMQQNNYLLSDAQRFSREAQQHLASEVADLLSRRDETHLSWQGSTFDLMEALHVAYLTAMITDREGNPLPFSRIVRRVCSQLSLPVPRNPYDYARRGTMRKGIVRLNYFDRYCRQLKQGVANPFTQNYLKAL